jgi:alpha-tubulin suppressor-like RCC1 family protein
MCGSNEASQLAMKNATSMAQPQRAAALDIRVVHSVACGANFTVAVTKRGELIGWGAGEYGQIGAPCVAQQAVPRIIKGLEPTARIDRVAAGSGHVLALSVQFQVYSFGAGLHGALGHGNTESMCVPKLPNLRVPNQPTPIATLL